MHENALRLPSAPAAAGPQDQTCAALAALTSALGLYWAEYDADGTRLAALLPPASANCASGGACPLLALDACCNAAHVFSYSPPHAPGHLVACHGSPLRPPAENVVKALADSLHQTVRAEQEMHDTVRELASTYQELAVAYGILEAISLPSSRELIAGAVLAHLNGAIGASGGCVLSLDQGNRALPLASQDMTPQDLALVQQWVQEHASQAPLDAPLSFQVGERQVLLSSLRRDENWCGLLALCRPAETPFGSREAKLVEATSRQAALAIQSRVLVDDLRQLFLSTIEALVAAIEAKDPYTCGHSRRVAGWARATAEGLGLPPSHVEDLYTAAVVHDVGKIGVDTAILRKQGHLSEVEWQAVRTHPDRGAGIIGCVPQLRHIIAAVRHHHERCDGRGYPFGLADTQIPLDALVIAVCDAYDAMTSERPYRGALTPQVAREELSRCGGTQFSAQVVDAFLKSEAA